jgi:RecA-family ATPase
LRDLRAENDIVDLLMAEQTEPDWLVKDFLLQGTLVCYAGDAGSGKSIVTHTIALALAAGCEALSGIVPAAEPKRVLYFDEENSPQDRAKYLQRSYNGLFRKGDGPDLANLQENFFGLPYWLGDAGWSDTVANCIEQVNPHLMVFDTATPCFSIQDENDNAEAQRVIQEVRRLMRMCNPVASAIVLRHSKVTDQKGVRTMRGAKAWKSAADGVIFQVRNPGRPRRHNLQLTRIEPDKTRAYGLSNTIYITPHYTDEDKSGLVLDASFDATGEHKRALAEEEGE